MFFSFCLMKKPSVITLSSFGGSHQQSNPIIRQISRTSVVVPPVFLELAAAISRSSVMSFDVKNY